MEKFVRISIKLALCLILVSACAKSSLPANQESRESLFAHFAPFPILSENANNAEVSIFFAKQADDISRVMALGVYVANLEQAGFVSDDDYFWNKGVAQFSMEGRTIFFYLNSSSAPMKTAIDTVLSAFPAFKVEELGNVRAITLELYYNELSMETLEGYLKELEDEGFTLQEERGHKAADGKEYEFSYMAFDDGSMILDWTYWNGTEY
jgi:hypothetical protein